MKILAELFHVNGQADGRQADMTNILVACRYFANAPKSVLVGFYTIKTVFCDHYHHHHRYQGQVRP